MTLYELQSSKALNFEMVMNDELDRMEVVMLYFKIIFQNFYEETKENCS
jgi:hypothetical protein